ncbi:hypothetical protein Pcinc_031737 [Petrolisthes cinctipes]|uniref:Uncharacterized protein n=1 Tax=Petrolisthes cinctipes TaxID=88211 RepID=A0AAE1K4G0_PETCI|nr:hypothetical protein Pcinc_031737 [Petrolisthes cinctipes]
MLGEYRDTIAITATILTILQFLSGTDICRRIVKQGSTGDISGFPFVGGVFSTRIVKQGSTGDISGFPFVGGVFSTRWVGV